MLKHLGNVSNKITQM